MVEASGFASTFKPCPSKALPKKFENGDRAKVCLVYLSPRDGELTAVSWPTEEFDPIIWTGKVESLDSGKNNEKSSEEGWSSAPWPRRLRALNWARRPGPGQWAACPSCPPRRPRA